jgi:hypothetical protein
VKSIIELLEIDALDSNQVQETVMQCLIYFDNYEDDSNFAREYPAYILREVNKILKVIHYDIKLLRSIQSIDQQIKEIFDSLIMDESPVLDTFDDKLFYYSYTLFTIIRHQKIIDFLKSGLTLAQFESNLESYSYNNRDRDQISLSAFEIASIPGINRKITRESERFISSYSSRRHKDTLKYVLQEAQSLMPAYRVNLCNSDGLLCKKDFLLGWQSRYYSYQQNPIVFCLQPGDIVNLQEGEFILDKSLIPIKL